MLQLTADERRALRARAHGLKPVVSISQNGLSDAVLKEIEVSLNSHELIKIRVYGDDRDAREAWLAEICERLDAAAVQHIGKLLVVYRPSPQSLTKQQHPRPSVAKAAPRRTKRSFQGGNRKT